MKTGENVINETKKPEAKEWWLSDCGQIQYCCGLDFQGHQVFQDIYGVVDWVLDVRGWRHLPECTGFDWVEPEPEKWPRYYVNAKGEFKDGTVLIKRTDATFFVCVFSGGEESSRRQWGSDNGEFVRDGDWIELTESEALARLDKKCPDCGEVMQDGHADVCPEAWVTQDRVPARFCDQFRWTDQCKWMDVYSTEYQSRHSDKGSLGDSLQLRCRRKDLPVAATEQPKRREMTDAEQKCADVPQGFVEIRDGRHVLRENIDYFQGEYGDGPTWNKVTSIVAGETIAYYDDGDRYCCHVSDAPQDAVTPSQNDLDQFLPSTQQAFDDLHRRCSDLSGQVDRLKREVQTVVHSVEAAQDRYDRSLPVTVEWLRSVGFESHGGHHSSVQIKFATENQVATSQKLTYWPDHIVKWTLRSDDGNQIDLAESIPNRGRVIDLLSGLGVEIKVATSNLSATSSFGKWAMDQA